MNLTIVNLGCRLVSLGFSRTWFKGCTNLKEICVKDERRKECLEYTGAIADKLAVETREFFVEANENGECQIIDNVKEAK